MAKEFKVVDRDGDALHVFVEKLGDGGEVWVQASPDADGERSTIVALTPKKARKLAKAIKAAADEVACSACGK